MLYPFELRALRWIQPIETTALSLPYAKEKSAGPGARLAHNTDSTDDSSDCIAVTESAFTDLM